MTDYSELLARLGAGLPYRAVPTTAAERQADPAVIKNKIDEDALRAELAECAAAIRALIAERDAAVAAEREACARVCDEILHSYKEITERNCGEAAICAKCSSTIRARSHV